MTLTRCKNCGDRTNLKKATQERIELGWCARCVDQAAKCRRTTDGDQAWPEPKDFYDREPKRR